MKLLRAAGGLVVAVSLILAAIALMHRIVPATQRLFVPKVAGSSASEARAALVAAGFTTIVVCGSLPPAESTDPHVGSRVARGTPITLYLRAGKIACARRR